MGLDQLPNGVHSNQALRLRLAQLKIIVNRDGR